MGNICCCKNKSKETIKISIIPPTEEDIEEEILRNNFDIKQFNALFIKRHRENRGILMTDLLDVFGTRKIVYKNILEL